MKVEYENMWDGRDMGKIRCKHRQVFSENVSNSMGNNPVD